MKPDLSFDFWSFCTGLDVYLYNLLDEQVPEETHGRLAIEFALESYGRENLVNLKSDLQELLSGTYSGDELKQIYDSQPHRISFYDTPGSTDTPAFVKLFTQTLALVEEILR